MNIEISLGNEITGQLFKAIYDFINFTYILHYSHKQLNLRIKHLTQEYLIRNERD